MTIRYSFDKNYSFTSSTRKNTYSIIPLDATLVWDNSSFAYNGRTQSPKVASINGLASNDQTKAVNLINGITYSAGNIYAGDNYSVTANIPNGSELKNYNFGTSAQQNYAIEKVDTTSHGPKTVKVSFENVSTIITIKVVQTQTSVDTVGTVAIIGGSVIGVAVLAVGIFFFLKMFKL